MPAWSHNVLKLARNAISGSETVLCCKNRSAVTHGRRPLVLDRWTAVDRRLYFRHCCSFRSIGRHVFLLLERKFNCAQHCEETASKKCSRHPPRKHRQLENVAVYFIQCNMSKHTSTTCAHTPVINVRVSKQTVLPRHTTITALHSHRSMSPARRLHRTAHHISVGSDGSTLAPGSRSALHGCVPHPLSAAVALAAPPPASAAAAAAASRCAVRNIVVTNTPTCGNT